MPDQKLIETQLKKLRRRIEEFLRHTTPKVLIIVADTCGIKVPKTLRDRYKEDG